MAGRIAFGKTGGKNLLALQESREKFRALVRASPDAVTATDLRGRITEVSDRTLVLHGFRDASGILGKNSFDFIAPEDRARARENAEKALAAGHVGGIQYVLLRKNGSRFTGEMSVSRLDGPDGRPYGFIATVRDITKRREAEMRLMAQFIISGILAGSRSLDEAAPQVIVAICRQLGWDWGELWSLDMGQGTLYCTELWHDPSVRYPAFEKATRNTTFKRGSGLPGRAWNRHGPVWISDVTEDRNFLRTAAAEKEQLRGAFAFPIMAGKEFLGVMSFFSRDMRKPDDELLRVFSTLGQQMGQFEMRRRAEERLRESEEKYRSIVENSRDCVMITDADGAITYLSPACNEVLGIEPNKLLGRQFSVMHPEDAARVRRISLKAQKGEGGAHVEYRVITGKGHVGWVSHSWSPILSRGKLRVNVSLLHNITGRKKGEAFRREYYELVEKEIEKKTRELRKQKEELERKNRLLEEFKRFALRREYELTELRNKVKMLKI